MGISASFAIHLTDLASPNAYAIRNLIAFYADLPSGYLAIKQQIDSAKFSKLFS